MQAVSVEVQHTCRSCQQPIACNAIVPQVTCDRCGRAAAIEARIWKLVLHEAVKQGGGLDKGREKTAALTTDVGQFQVVYRRGAPACLACHAPIKDEALQKASAEKIYKCECQNRTPSRAMVDVGLPEIAFLVQEDPDLLWPPERKEAVALKCVGCGGAQTVSGTTPRIFPCSFCKTQVYVPDDLWSLLHPVRPVKPFLLMLAGGAPAKKKGENSNRLPRFSDVYDVCVAGNGTLFAVLVVEQTGVAELFALDHEANVKWRKELPPKHRSGTRLAWMASGHVCVWADSVRSLFGLRETDGTTEAELGADKSGQGVDKLDLRKAVCVSCDPDGSILVGKQESGGVRFLRYAPTGQPIPLWPNMPVPTPWNADEYPPALEGASERLVGAQNVVFGIGWDGLLHVSGDQAVATYDRSGKRVMCKPDENNGVTTGGPAYGAVSADRSGNVFTFEGGLIVRRYEKGRGRVFLSTDDLLKTETVGTLGPDGTVWCLGPEGVIRRFGPDRSLQWASGGARKADREAAESE